MAAQALKRRFGDRGTPPFISTYHDDRAVLFGEHATKADIWIAEKALPLCPLFGGLAQLVERQHGMLEVSGSNPLPSTFWGVSSVGRAPESHSGGQRFESATLHWERCRSGRTGTTGNRVPRQNRGRGFESPPLRPSLYF